MIRVILHPSGEVRALPETTLCTWAPSALDGAVGVGVEVRRYANDGVRHPSLDDDWPMGEFIIEYPTTLTARRAADASALEEYGEADGGLDVIDDRGSHLESELGQRSLGERGFVHLGERDGLGRRLWRLAEVEIPRELLGEANRLIDALGVAKVREGFDRGLATGHTLGYALRLAVVQAGFAQRDGGPLQALRERCHAIVGHAHGA